MMKFLLSLSLMFVSPSVFCALAATPEDPEDVTLSYREDSTTEWTDTIAVISDAHNIVVTKNGDKMLLTVHGSGSDKDYYYRYGVEPRVDSLASRRMKVGVDVPFAGNLQGSSSSMRFLKNIYVGVNMPVGPGKNLKAGWEIGVGEVLGFGYTPNKGATVFSVGFGFCYRSLNTSNDMIFCKYGDVLSLEGVPSDIEDPSATLSFWQLQFPLLLSQTISGKVGFNFGVLLNLNVAASGQSRWQNGETLVKCDLEGLHQRFFTPDVFATVGIRNILGAYVKFSPMNAMNRYVGPRMSMISAGLNFNF